MTAEAAPRPGPATPGAFAELEYGRLRACVHCGFCLPTCPTYAENGFEMDSPRGRIVLVQSLADGRLALTDSVARHLSLCLGCRACETACPSGVRYGQIIEAARAEVERQRPGSWLRRTLRRLAFGHVLPSPAALRLVAGALRLYQRGGLQRLVRGSGLLRLVPSGMAAAESLLPPLPPAARGRLPEIVPACGTARARVGFLHGCVQDAVFRSHNLATLRLLARNGFEVVVPRNQACCGALQAHGGDPERARQMARSTIAAFERAGVETVVVNTAGCGAHMKEYGHLLRRDAAWRDRAEVFGRRVADVTEVLARRPLAGPLGALPLRVTYHDPCHLGHGQRVRTEPRALLAAIPGVELVELRESEMCCGSAGTYNLTEPEMAERLLLRKVKNLETTGADVVATANPGCLLQIAAGVRQRGLALRVAHVVELLDEAYAAAERPGA